MSTLRTTFLMFSCVVLLNGCAAAAGFKVASLAVTGLSYLVTGKSLSDHVISGAMASDCALHRIIKGHSPCRARVQPLVAMNHAEPGVTSDSTRSASTDIVPTSFVDTGWYDIEVPIAKVALLESGDIDTGPRLFVVVGSYREVANAKKHQEREKDARIAPVVIEDQPHFRVVLGPFGQSISALVQSQMSTQNPSGWPVWLCASTLRAPPCFTQVAQLSP